MVRVAIKESSFCIVEFSLSPISKFIHSPNYVATTSFQALVLTIGGSSVFHCNPLRPTVYSLWNRYCGASVLRADITRTSRIRFSIAVLSIPCYFIDGRYYPQNVRRTAVLSCDSKVHPTSSFLISPHLNFRAANRVVCWLYLINRAYCSFFYIATTSRYALMSPLRVCGVWVARSHAALWSQVAATKNHEYYRTNPSIIYSRFMSKTEVVHWRFDCRVYVFVDCSFPLLILSALYLYCYHWSFALPFTVHLIFGQVGAKPTHYRSGTGNKITIESLCFIVSRQDA